MIVVDASIAVKWFVAEPGHEAADRVLSFHSDMIAPDRLLLEVANTMLRKTQRGEMSDYQASAALVRLPTLLVEIVPSQVILTQAFALARALNHQIYDCTYLALAIARNCPMITADTAFAGKAGPAGYSEQVIALADWDSSPS
jgi:hypothetical protein